MPARGMPLPTRLRGLVVVPAGGSPHAHTAPEDSRIWFAEAQA